MKVPSNSVAYVNKVYRHLWQTERFAPFCRQLVQLKCVIHRHRFSDVSRPTLRRWLKHYKEDGLNGLKSQSKRPKHSPNQKIFEEQDEWILKLRDEMDIGARRIQNELIREYDCHLTLASIQKVLQRNQVKPIEKPQKSKKLKRYQKAIPRERVQMDTCKIRPGMYQFTAVDDCTRYLVVEIYPRRTANNTLLFLDKVVEEMPFPIQHIQTYLDT